MVIASSSQLAIERSPLAEPIRFGANQALAVATALRCSLRRGMYPPKLTMPVIVVSLPRVLNGSAIRPSK